MKRIIKKTLSIVLVFSLVFMLAPSASADDTTPELSGKCGTNLSWSISDNTLTISADSAASAQTDNYTIFSPAPWKAAKEYFDKVIITGQSSNSPINIGDYAFFDCDNITDFDVSQCVINTVGDSAFKSCENAKNLPIPLKSVGPSAYSGCAHLKSIHPTTEDFNSSPDVIGTSAFYKCTSLEEISLTSTTKVGNYAFSYCEKLKTVNFGTNEITLGDNVFANTNLYQLSLKKNVHTSKASISGIDTLKHLVLYDQPFSIPDYYGKIFYPSDSEIFDENDFSELAPNATWIPYEEVEQVGSNILFSYNDGKASLYGKGEFYSVGTTPVKSFQNLLFQIDEDITSFYVDDGITNLPDIFTLAIEFNNLTTVKLSNTLTSIPKYYFCNSPKLKKIEFPDSITTLNGGILRNSGVSTVVLPSNLKVLPYEMFMDCKNLHSIDLPESVETIEISAFNNSGLTSLETNATTIGNLAFIDCTSLTELNLKSDKVTLGDSTLENTPFTKLDLSNIVSIGNSCFKGCQKLETFETGNQITQIPDYAFLNCSKIKSISFGENISSIGKGSFTNCSQLLNLVFPDSLATINNEAFTGCTNLKEVTFGKGLTSIGSNVFTDDNELRSIKFTGDAADIEDDAFTNDTLTAYYDINNETFTHIYLLNDFGGTIVWESYTEPNPTPSPTAAPTEVPTATPAPTEAPTATPAPTEAPTATPAPTEAPTATPAPTEAPTVTPTVAPTVAPTMAPTTPVATPANNSNNNLTSLLKVNKFLAKGAKKSAKLSWQKNKYCSGYEIQYSLKSNFKKAKKVTIKSKATKKKTIKKLKKKKKYYFRIRSFLKQGSGKVYGKWTKKNCKIK